MRIVFDCFYNFDFVSNYSIFVSRRSEWSWALRLSAATGIELIEKYLAIEPRSGSKGHLHSQGKLTTPMRENRKIRHENLILKANERLHKVWKLKIYRIVSKNICANLVRISLPTPRRTFKN
jgi:hypothetical protein